MREPDSLLAKMFSGVLPPPSLDDQGAYMIDRTPEYFKPILNYLRTRELIIDPNISEDGVLAEARFFGIQSLVDQIEKIPEAKRVTTVHELLNKLFDFQDKVIQKLLNTKGVIHAVIVVKTEIFGPDPQILESLQKN